MPPSATLLEPPVLKTFVPLDNKDLTAKRCEFLFRPPALLDRSIHSLLRDKRDAPIAYLWFNISVVTIPSALLLYLLPPSHPLGLLYLALNAALFYERFILGLHFSEHVPIFNPKTSMGSLLNMMPSHFLCVFFGLPSGMYRLHHVVMHHCENNLFPYDVSSTEPYQRDSILHFLMYWARFMFAICIELPFYAIKKRRYKLAIQAMSTFSIYVAVATLLAQTHPTQVLYTVVLPYIIGSFALMFGNWSQHIFIDPERPRSNYSLTYNIMSSEANWRTFNDGYHIIHHLNSRLHWTELPSRFMATLPKYAESDAIVFRDLSYADVGLFAVTGQLGKLADHYVNVGQKKRSRQELIEMFKSRFVPIRGKDALKGPSEDE